MAKFRCVICGNITYALRYFKSDSKWYKPKKNLRYCEYCNNIFQENNLNNTKLYVMGKRCNYPNKTPKVNKRIVMYHYSNGKMVCSCCGESQIEFLTIDHINNNGKNHRKQIKRFGDTFYRWLIQHGFPTGFRVLCYNCNCSRRYSPLKTCPHQLNTKSS